MVPCSLHTRTNRLRIGDRIRDPSRMAMQAPTKLHRSGGPRGFGRKEHFTRQLLSMCPRPDSTQSTRGPDSYLFFSPHQTQLSTPRPESSRLGALRARPRSFDHSDRDASSPPTQMCSARDARGQTTIFSSHTKSRSRIRAPTRTTQARLPCRHLASNRFEVMIENSGFTIKNRKVAREPLTGPRARGPQQAHLNDRHS